jgi:hypothetical protein
VRRDGTCLGCDEAQHTPMEELNVFGSEVTHLAQNEGNEMRMVSRQWRI